MAQPNSTSTIQAVLEAINLLGVDGVFWLGGQQSGGGDIIMSQNYPSIYPRNYNEVNISHFHLKMILFTILVQEWQLEVPIGYIQLVFVDFFVAPTFGGNCDDDWVEVSYGSYSEKFCGNSIPGPFTSPGPTMTVRIHTDGSGGYRGFRAVWRTILEPMDFIWVGDNSTVDSNNLAPGFPMSG